MLILKVDKVVCFLSDYSIDVEGMGCSDGRDGPASRGMNRQSNGVGGIGIGGARAGPRIGLAERLWASVGSKASRNSEEAGSGGRRQRHSDTSRYDPGSWHGNLRRRI